MSGIVIVGLLYRPRMWVFRTVGWVNLSLVVMYLFDSYLLYLRGE